MSGPTSGYRVDPVGEYVVGVVIAGAMRVRRGREGFVFGARDVCTWDPSAAHSGTPQGCTGRQARLLMLESPTLERIVRGPEPRATDLYFSRPLTAVNSRGRQGDGVAEADGALGDAITENLQREDLRP
jgi:hypothetical protein